MTGSAVNTPVASLSERLALVTHHHLLTRVPVKLDFDDWNYGSWEYFFDQLCDSYEVSKYIHGLPTGTSTSEPIPLTPEELKVDKIVLSWIFTTLSDPLQKRLVVARPKSAKAAWDFLSELVQDNKRSRVSALKTELRSITLGDLSMEAYFQKIESLMTILASFDSPSLDEDVVHYAIAGLPEKYNQVCGYMHYQNSFPDLKTVRSLLITEEMRLKSKPISTPLDSSSPMVLLAESGNTRRTSSMPPIKSSKPCYNFAKGYCRYGDACRFVHDKNAKTGTNSSGNTRGHGATDETNVLLKALIQQLGTLSTSTVASSTPTSSPNPQHVVFNTGPPLAGPPGFPAQPHGYQYAPSLSLPSVAYPSPMGQPIQSTAQHVSSHLGTHLSQPSSLSQPGTVGSTSLSGQATTLPHAFNVNTLHDPASNTWNMDTGFHNSSSASPM